MPTYEFRCPSGHSFERFYRKIADAATELECPVCGKVAARQLSGGAGLVFKGSGFYLTDYGRNAHRGGGAAASSDKSGSSESKSESSGSESKTDSKADASKPAPASGGESKGGEKGGEKGGSKSDSSTSSKPSGPKD